jgi:hypothetical protein
MSARETSTLSEEGENRVMLPGMAHDEVDPI